ncbi:unnamed protein product [Cercospora beticola]|nr:unnamed protein product [Cercospora beticola]
MSAPVATWNGAANAKLHSSIHQVTFSQLSPSSTSSPIPAASPICSSAPLGRRPSGLLVQAADSTARANRVICGGLICLLQPPAAIDAFNYKGAQPGAELHFCDMCRDVPNAQCLTIIWVRLQMTHESNVKSIWRSWAASPRPFLGLFLISLVSLVFFNHFVFDTDPNKCQALVSEGQWYNGKSWLIPGCTTIPYDGKHIKQCVGNETRRFTLIGDLHVQRLYFQLGRRLKHDIEVPDDREQDLSISKDNITVQYFYDPQLNRISLIDSFASEHEQERRPPLLAVVGAGNTYAERGMAERYAAIVGELASKYQTSPAKGLFTHERGPGDLVLFTPAEEPYNNGSTKNEPFHELNTKLEALEHVNILWSFRDMVSGRQDLYKADGPRVADKIIKKRVDLLLNFRCNAKVGSKMNSNNNAICCGAWRGPNWIQIALLLLGFAILPLVTIVDFKLQLLSDSARPVMRAFCALTAVLASSWIADRTHIFEHGTRLGLVKPTLFLMIIVTFLIGFATVRRSAIKSKPGEAPQSQPFLPRDQTDE